MANFERMKKFVFAPSSGRKTKLEKYTAEVSFCKDRSL